MDFSNLTLYTPPRIDSAWTRKDILGALRVRFSIGRSSYQVEPGLYKLGNPGKDSEVLVSSNYKLSFDVLRRSLGGMDAWILVLQTYGINVWCAAGKGTFGTDELIRRIRAANLSLYVDHKRIILPQLGAPGVSAPKVKEVTGYQVKFGPVRAEDIKAYISAGLKKTQEMRSVKFGIKDRFTLAPVEVVNSLKFLLLAILFMAGISGITSQGYSLTALWMEGLTSALYLVLAYVSGAFLSPVFLPYLPFRHFGGKGLVAGMTSFGAVFLLTHSLHSMLYFLGWILMSGAISSYLAMNFTGSSTFTSLSGVRKEMRLFVPVQIALAASGLTLVMFSKFI